MKQILVNIDYLPCVNYSMINNGVQVCNSLVLENADDRDWSPLTVTLSGPCLKESVCHLESLRKGQATQLNLVKIMPDIKVLSEITEAINTTFVLTVKSEEVLLFEQEYPITLLSYEEWSGSGVMPEHLAAFVVPNNPYLPKIKLAAAKFLEKWTGSSDFDEYQTQDRNRVRAQVAAIFEALRSEGIIYSAPPASFETTGQRIRMADKVLKEKQGTCLDTSLLIASCLEEIGIFPIVIMLKGHALVGAWLTPNVFPQVVCDDVSYLLKEMADGNNNLVVLESTAITSSSPIPFEEAVKSATVMLRDEKRFLYFIDIHRCRLSNIKPMPQRIQVDGTWTFDNEGLAHENATVNVSNFSHYDLRLDTKKPTTKQMIWERKLLDFSLRNNLLNTRLGRRVVPFISFEIENLEDHLQKGEDYHITPTPGKKLTPNPDGMYDSKQQATEHETYVAELIRDHKIASYLAEPELQNALKFIYRTARTSLEENGANSLFLALGMLKWYENNKSQQPRFAPILLLPVDMVRKSGNNFLIRKRDEDIMLNITLVELLKQNFAINLDSLKELPQDKNSVDVKMVFTYFRRAIIDQKKWNVLEESMLGLFSFNKFVMWNDIHSNADKLQENVIVSSLIANQDQQGIDTDPVDARDIDKANAPMDFAIPLDVDSSQMEAIVESGRGRSFILHGPPGTGKSQTITNMIANALYQDKRVLFVAEKMAALSVVQSRLEKINLAPFCLELHSNKATKKHFLEQMEQVLKVTKIKSPEEYEEKSKELYKERKELISYMEALHRKGPSGLSLYECISEYIAINEEETLQQLPPLEHITATYIEQCRKQVEPLSTIISIVGQINQCGLIGLEPIDNKISTLESIKTLLKQFKEVNAQYTDRLNHLNDALLFDLKTEDDLQWLAMFTDYLKFEKSVDELHETKLASYRQDFLQIDVDAYLKEWKEILSKWFLPRYFKKKQYMKAIQVYGNIFESSLEETLQHVADYQEGQKRQAAQLEELVAFARARGINHQDRHTLYLAYLDENTAIRREDFLQDAPRLVSLHQQLADVIKQIQDLTSPQNTREVILQHQDAWMNDYGKMSDWFHWVDKKREMKSLELEPVTGMIEEGVSPLHAVNAYVKGLFHLLIKNSIDENKQLRMFNGMKFRQQIERYKHDTELFQELSKEELYCKLASRVPSSSAARSDGSEMGILKRNIANGGRGNSIRSIIDNISHLLPRLCPCMLMSPISVAQYIDLNAEKFDLVIFDEASQMPTSEAVGAIARGKALVVVGDSKQMPPTSFFMTNQVEEEDADIDDMESILDDCITLSLCEHQLNWHYRSKHESLIAFSNSQYYGNHLLTFPSIDDHTAKVRLVPVNGVYDKGRTRSNPEESKAIVEEIIRRLSDPELQKYSIGVVAFSKVQGDLIEDDLTEELDKHPELKDVAYNREEPIFIKNLENVQGDERDVILFSIGYGADKNGKVSMNFGPLNNACGERRLNVAVSRARYEMIVFSTLKAGQIDLKRSNAKGVEGLKYFLEYAETGKLPIVAEDLAHDTDKNVMVDQICEALNQAGYLTEPFVGRSNFKIDIAVSTQEHPDQYLLGILCDGKSYYETKTTRDREIVQPNVLKMLHWKVMRVYSIDWYENRERAMNQILQELEAIKNGTKAKEKVKEKPYVFDAKRIQESRVSNKMEKNNGLVPYSETKIRLSDNYRFNPFSPETREIIRKIMYFEQPITESYLCKRVAKIIGFNRPSTLVQRAVNAFLEDCYMDPYSIDGIHSYWLTRINAKDYDLYRAPSPRALQDIPAIEIVNAVKEVMMEEFSLPKDKIPSLVVKKLGFASARAKIIEVVMEVLDTLEKEGTVQMNDDLVSLC